MTMQLRTGLAGLVALVWSTAAILIFNSAGGPPSAVACWPAPEPGAEGRLVTLSDGSGSPQTRSEDTETTCVP